MGIELAVLFQLSNYLVSYNSWRLLAWLWWFGESRPLAKCHWPKVLVTVMLTREYKHVPGALTLGCSSQEGVTKELWQARSSPIGWFASSGLKWPLKKGWSPNHCLKETSNVLGLFSDCFHLTAHYDYSEGGLLLPWPSRQPAGACQWHSWVILFFERLGLAPSPAARKITKSTNLTVLLVVWKILTLWYYKKRRFQVVLCLDLFYELIILFIYIPNASPFQSPLTEFFPYPLSLLL